eukprot:5892514-Prymnesium_polylepis.3
MSAAIDVGPQRQPSGAARPGWWRESRAMRPSRVHGYVRTLRQPASSALSSHPHSCGLPGQSGLIPSSTTLRLPEEQVSPFEHS